MNIMSMKMRPAIEAMLVSEKLDFPIQKLNSVRTTASELGAIHDRHYVTRADRDRKIISVTRLR